MGQIIDLSHFSIWLLILSICKGFALFTIIHTLYKDKFNSDYKRNESKTG